MLKKLRSDRRGVGWVLGVAVLSIVFMPVIYFPLCYAWDNMLVVFTSNYTFTGVTANVITIVRMLIAYMLVFGVLFTINWAIVQAKMRRYQA